MRLAQNGARQQHALELPTGQLRHLFAAEARNTCGFERVCRSIFVNGARQVQKAGDRDRQRRVDVQLLRHIADPQPLLPRDLAFLRFQRADQHPQQCRFP